MCGGRTGDRHTSVAESNTHGNGELYERRIEDRRKIEALEARVSQYEMKHVLLQQRVDMLVMTVNSRYDALEHGQQNIVKDLAELHTYKERILGAFGLIVLLSVTGIIGGVIAIIKAIKGP